MRTYTKRQNPITDATRTLIAKKAAQKLREDAAEWEIHLAEYRITCDALRPVLVATKIQEMKIRLWEEQHSRGN